MTEMKTCVLLISALFAVANSLPAIHHDGRIVGGDLAAEGQFKYMASLRRDDNHHFCGGSIINNQWILTAAHCLVDRVLETTYAVVGTNYIDRGGVRHNASKIIYHENYDAENILNDVGLIKVEGTIEYNDLVQPIQLKTEFVGGNVPVVISGWGRYDDGPLASNELKYMNFTTLDYDTCKPLLGVDGAFLVEEEICVFNSNDSGVCNGDSGSPLVDNGLQIAVASWVVQCAEGFPDVFTRTLPYLDWIETNIANN